MPSNVVAYRQSVGEYFVDLLLVQLRLTSHQQVSNHITNGVSRECYLLPLCRPLHAFVPALCKRHWLHDRRPYIMCWTNYWVKDVQHVPQTRTTYLSYLPYPTGCPQREKNQVGIRVTVALFQVAATSVYLDITPISRYYRIEQIGTTSPWHSIPSTRKQATRGF